MNIVFLTHYFPPLNSSGARRINAFAKYLAAKGHQITVITTRKTERDGLLTEEVPAYLTLLELGGWGGVARTEPVANPSALGQMAATRSRVGQLLLRMKRSVMTVAGQLIDHRLFFAIQFAFPWLADKVKNAITEADVVMSSCPPWPTHLAGRLAKARFGKRWVADYRDQFSGNHILRGSALSRPIEVWLERWLIKTADQVVAISGPMKEYYELFHPAVVCIENGYDEDLFEQARARIRDQGAKVPAEEFVIRYMGTITGDRIPVALFQALALINQQPGLRVVAEFYGESTLLREALPEVSPQARPFVRFCSQLPYQAAIEGMLTADALFFIETSDFSSHSARGVLTTKLFEYLAARKPVVAEISARSLAAQYIQQSGLGVVVSEESGEIQRGLERLRVGEFKPDIDDEFIQSLSRRVKAHELEQLFQRLMSSTGQAAA